MLENIRLTGQDVSQKGFYAAQIDADSEKHAALSPAAEVHIESSPLNGELAHRIELGIDFYHEVTRFEISLIRCALRQTKGNQKRAARLLGIGNTTLNGMIKRHGIGVKPTY